VSGRIAPQIIDLGSRWRWVFSFTPWSLYPGQLHLVPRNGLRTNHESHFCYGYWLITIAMMVR